MYARVCVCVFVSLSDAVVILRSVFRSLLLSVIAIKRHFSSRERERANHEPETEHKLESESESEPEPEPQSEQSQLPGVLFERNARVVTTSSRPRTQTQTSITVLPRRIHTLCIGPGDATRLEPSRAEQSAARRVRARESDRERAAHVERA